MHSKTITVKSEVTNTITNLSVMIAPRQGDSPAGYSSDGFIHSDWAWFHAELDKPINVPYGDDQNPYVDAIGVNFTPSNAKTHGTQCHFTTIAVRSDERDNALNMYDTFVIRLVEGSESGPSAVMECSNSNGSGGTVEFPK